MYKANEPLIPKVCEIVAIRQDTPDVKTFRVLTLDGQKPFIHKPGQCAMLSMPGVGAQGFATLSPTAFNPAKWITQSIRWAEKIFFSSASFRTSPS